MSSLVRIDKFGIQAQTALKSLATERRSLPQKFKRVLKGALPMYNYLRQVWADEQGQDIAEYAVMLAVILVLVVGTVRLIGSNANNAFSATASAISQ
jgi:Flp pilus assembly pilin Flp